MRELTAMQAACWLGRSIDAPLGAVAAHLYAEFDGWDLDPERCRRALETLGRQHPMLALSITADGRQQLPPQAPKLALEVDDFRTLEAAAQAAALLQKRQSWTHQTLALEQGQATRFSLSLLANGAVRLHVDADMTAVDPGSFRVLMNDFALFYQQADAAVNAPSFFQWWDRARSDQALRIAREQDRAWWRAQLPQLLPAPTLPLRAAGAAPHSDRLAAWLSPAQLQALRQCARQQRVTLSTLLLAVFAVCLGEACGDRRFRLNVPFFRRPALGMAVAQVVGEFANTLLIDVALDEAENLAALCQQLASQWQQRLSHSGYSGVELLRDLSRHHGSTQGAPVVFTAAVDLPEGELFAPAVQQVFGDMNWVVSQGPQVALDAQLVQWRGGLLLNWDVRLDALPQPWLSALFQRCLTQLQQLAATPAAVLSQPLQPDAGRRTPLTPLQQAYLLGRSEQLPLGGVAMQEFREYRGVMSAALLRQRLQTMAARHPALRTRIDAEQRCQWLLQSAPLNLQQEDWRAASADWIAAQLAVRRREEAHALCAADRPPWAITLFELPDAELVVFVRMDALIVDGRAIAQLMRELFEGEPAPSPPALPASVPSAAERDAAADYWAQQLAAVSGPPQLPWRTPLAQIARSHYARRSRTLGAAALKALRRAGAQQQLFLNSTLMALVLEVLSHWQEGGELCVAVPVAPPEDGPLANRSSFLALCWPQDGTPLAARAARLQQHVLTGLQHVSGAGVALARMLLERFRQGPVLPVVVTNGLSWPTAAADSPMQWCSGLTQTPQVALDLRFSHSVEGGLQFDADYAEQALGADVIEALLDALVRAVEQVVDSGDLALHSGRLIDTGHYAANNADDSAHSEPFLVTLAEHLFGGCQSGVALVQGEQQWSYAQLGAQVRRTMAGLQARGLQPGDTVMLCLPRSAEHITVMLACALLGLVWVPVDATAPPARQQYWLAQAQPALRVSLTAPPADVAWCTPQQLDSDAPAALPDADTLAARSLSRAAAYCLFTSGTTGQPKGVVLHNRATANVIGSTRAAWQLSADDVVMSVTPLHHDMSVFDLLGSFTSGATLVLPQAQEEKDALQWNRLVAQHRISVWCSVPAMVDMLLCCCRDQSLASLRLVAQGGDFIKPAVLAQLRRWAPQAQLYSLGGPTETTIWSIWHLINAADQPRVPYGRPLPGNQYWLLDEHGRHCPVGVRGRIHSSGVNLALGYLQPGGLSQQDFITVDDPDGRSLRAYRSGDCGRYRPDGVLMFDSRVDGYIKVRGVRLSLADIETELGRHGQVAQVLAVACGDAQQGELELGVVYVPVAGAALTTATLRDHARQCLPASHWPSRWCALPQLPLTANGKPDRAAAIAALSAPPPDPILAIYLDVLGHRQAPANVAATFAELGLRPQHLKPLCQRLAEAFSVQISPQQLLHCRTVADVEQLLAAHA
ncbi:amino acid adenylation domain-containing protein [Isoalcanivorax beigongshangi]|uniref:Amino acid adenylation domain-containing protein n=1 Tax=Isoalcanivorax beigongshangi TaxID=3238810 RepID=A0ABV4AF81_9GAMM